MSPEPSIVERLYETLVDEVRRTRPELLQESFTVAEIYQNLVPYRTHRERVGAEMNGDYEHALLRLLAGEGGYVTLESDVARSRLEEELNSIHPDTGVYRNFAACEVRLRPERLEDLEVSADMDETGEPDPSEGHESGGGSAGVELDPGPDVSAPDLVAETANGSDRPEDGSYDGGPGDVETDEECPVEDESSVTDSDLAVVGDGNGSAGAAEEDAAGGDSGTSSSGDEDTEGEVEGEGGTCLWCREDLPDREDLRFCPFCGSSVDLRPCPECGAEVESEWIFCVACGMEVDD